MSEYEWIDSKWMITSLELPLKKITMLKIKQRLIFKEKYIWNSRNIQMITNAEDNLGSDNLETTFVWLAGSGKWLMKYLISLWKWTVHHIRAIEIQLLFVDHMLHFFLEDLTLFKWVPPTPSWNSHWTFGLYQEGNGNFMDLVFLGAIDEFLTN